MKALKIIAGALAALIVLVLILHLAAKKDYRVEREIIINKPVAEVFNYVKMLQNQDNYNKWVMMDPDMKKGIKGVDGTVGAIYYWDGEKGGKGEQELTSMVENQRINLELRFEKPFKGIAFAGITTEAMGENKTKVKWDFSGKAAFPMTVVHAIFGMDKMMGPDLQSGLEVLKAKLENN